MLIEHLSLLACPICKILNTWTVDGITHENRIIDGTVICKNEHSWKVSQEILRFDKEDASEGIIYSDGEKTGYPKQVGELERASFLDFIGPYFRSLRFRSEYVLVSGEPILYFRFLQNKITNFITSYNDEGTLRQLHEMAVSIRIHEKHSFIRSRSKISTDFANQLIIFPKIKVKNLSENSLVVQFIRISAETKGKIIWTGEKYKLEVLSNI